MEDSDMKIFGQKQAQSCDDELRLIALMEEQRANGNTEKAAKLEEIFKENEPDVPAKMPLFPD